MTIDGAVLVVGAGRMGSAVAAALRAAGVAVQGPTGRGATGGGVEIVLLAVPDAEIAAAAALIAPGRLVGHVSGATTLAPLAPHEAFSIHPLLTVTGAGVSFAGVPAAIASSTPRAREAADALAVALGLRGFAVADADRAAYHAAASIASNFLVTVEGFAEELAATAGIPRDALAPLVRAAVGNWAAAGAHEALTGPVARGDDDTVARQRAAVAERLPDRLALFDALTAATRELAAAREPVATPAAAPGDARAPVPERSQPMRVVRTVSDLRAALAGARAGRIGFVPTMGALHEGHLSLLRAARAENDTVVLSIFVNPTQFDEPADLAAYPRTEQRDAALAATAGADILFAPSAAEMYPDGFSTSVSVAGSITERLEGAQRGRAHFDGVATVVVKLLLAALPDAAYFGAKDAQQVVVVRRAVADLNIPVRIAVVPTSRDDDGLARSSRNTRLSRQDRRRALAIPRALVAMRDAAGRGERDAPALCAHGRTVLAQAGIAAEYLAVVDPVTLEDVQVIDRPVLAVVAARVGETRLIDNVLIDGATRAARDLR